MEKLKHKLKGHGGFTLIEMLIVVAIIAILIAVSIPLVNTALERAREATDAANERSFKAVLTISYTNGKYEVEGASPVKFEVGKAYVYDAAKGTLADSVEKTYGKSTNVKGVDDVDRRDRVLWGYVDTNGVTHMVWSTSTSNLKTDYIKNQNLIGPEMVDAV